MTYSAVSPVRDEAENIERLHACLAAQSVLPLVWVIVDNGSEDGTDRIADRLAATTSWIRVIRVGGERAIARGAPVVRAFNAGLDELASSGPFADVVVKIDADVEVPPDYFERLLAAFASEPRLGIAGGLCYERVDGAWRPRHVARSHVRGAVRAYRAACLADVLPLEDRMGWDGIDELKAALRGWEARTLAALGFRHHRALGQRDGSWRAWLAQGDTAYYMGYRPSYLLARTLYRMSREPAAAAMACGYAAAAVRRAPRCPDADVRALLRSQQRFRSLPRRLREARGTA